MNVYISTLSSWTRPDELCPNASAVDPRSCDHVHFLLLFHFHVFRLKEQL